MRRPRESDLVYDAAIAVGSRAADHLAWLIDFAGRSLADADTRRRSEHELLLFCRQWHFRQYAQGPGRMTVIGFSGPIPVLDLQQIARRCVDYLCGKGPGRERGLWFNDEPIGFGLCWEPPAGPIIMSEGRTPAAHFIASIASLIGAIGDRLRQCQAPKCERMFVAARPKAIYCGKTCQNRATTAAYRAAHREQIVEAKHDHYKRRQREQLRAPNLDVKRRPRRAKPVRVLSE